MRVTSTRVVYENRWMRVHEDRTELPDGTAGLYGWIEKRPAAIIVPLEDGFVWLIQQYRHPVGEHFWEFPQGSFEDGAVDAEALARGELAEETGLRAGRLERLGRLYFAYGMSDQHVDVWCATDLSPGERALEHTEQGLIARRFARTEVERMVRENEIRDAASVAAWHLATR
jgi:8-oxo-dGTP pyrophosphatase MutT (NUDIX family)